MAEFLTVTKNGKEKQVLAGKQLEQALADGWTGAGTKRVDLETGAETVDTNEALDLQASGKGTIVAESEVRAERGAEYLEKQYGGDNAQTFGESAISTATFGLADPLLEGISELSEGDSGAVAARNEVNKTSAALGTAAGAIVGSVAPGFLPSSLAARAAAKVGSKVLASTGSKVAGLAVEGMVDGAFFGAGQAYADATISDSPVNVENIIAGMTSGALYGGIGGAAIGGLGKLSKRIDAKRVASSAHTAKQLKAVNKKFDDFADDIHRELATVNPTLAPTSPAIQKEINALRKSLPDGGVLSGSADDVNRITSSLNRIDDVESAAGRVLPDLQQKITQHELPDLASKSFYDEAGDITELGELAESFGVETKHTSERAEAIAKAFVVKKATNEVTSGVPGVANAAIKSESKATTNSGGLLNKVVGKRLGGVAGIVLSGPAKIKSGIESFIKLAGKPRKGTIPAATTILGSLSFDKNLGKRQKKTRRENFGRISKELGELATNPDKAKTNIHESLKEIHTLKPGMAEALSNKALERMMFLHRVLPRSKSVSAFGPDRWQPSNTEIDKFARIAAAAEDPYSIIDDMNSGKLTQEAVDTVKQLYPEIYHSVQMELIENAEQIRQNVGYAGRLQLGIMFQVATDAVLEPAFIQRMQENYALRDQEREQAGNGQYSTPGSNQKALASNATASQRLETVK